MIEFRNRKKLNDLIVSGNFSFYLSLICIALLSLHVHWLPPFLILWVVIWFIEKKDSLSWSSLKGEPSTNLFLMFVTLFVWQAVGLIFADSPEAGLERIIKRIAFILFPAVLFFPGEKIKRNIRFIMKMYAFFILIYITYCLINAFLSSFHHEEGKWVFRTFHELYTYESYFMGERLAGKVHPTYLAMYVITAMIISIDSFFEDYISKSGKILWFFISLIFFVVTLLLSSRAGVVAVVVVLPLFLFSRLVSKIPTWLMVSVMIAFITLFATVLLMNTRLRNTVEEISSENINETFNKDVRIMIWRSAWGAIRGDLLEGVGTGDASSELKKEFISRGYKEGFYNDLNAHNQFLEILLENGIIGLIIFLLIISYMMFTALRQHNAVLQFFTITVVIFFLFESMLNRLSGIMFFPLLTFLLIHYRNPGEA